MLPNIENYWILPANNKHFLADKCFEEIGEAVWSLSYKGSKIKTGDVVFIYNAAPTSAITWVCEVIDDDVDGEEKHPSDDYWVSTPLDVEGKPKIAQRFMLIRVVQEVLPEQRELLSLANLENHGKKHPQNLQHLRQEALDFVLDTLSQIVVEEDKDFEVPRSYKTYMAKHRVHQKMFRDLLFSRAENICCSVCGITEPRVLDAAHIEADSQGGAAKASNGAILCANHHRAYDAGLITYISGWGNKARFENNLEF